MDNNLLDEFVLEAKAHIATMESGLLRMETGEEEEEDINRLFRAAHSIKGTAGFFELEKIVELAHIIEDIFGEFRESRLSATPEMVDVLLAATDMLRELINDPATSDDYDTTATVASVAGLLNRQQEPPESTSPSEGISAWDLWNQLTSGDEQAAVTSEIVSPEESSLNQEQPAIEEDKPAAIDGRPPTPGSRSSKSHEVVIEDSVRVNVGLLNDLLSLAGEMVLRRNQLLRFVQDAGYKTQLDVVASGIDELTTQLQKKIMKTRMQPIANIFNKFPRIVRDLSRKLGKDVEISLRGMDVELDRSLIEALVDPMTHLVRNALDHGIEPTEVRQGTQKPLTASLVLRAYHESGRVIIEVCDDGAGIDCEKVKKKALQMGIVGNEKLMAMRESDVFNLIMAPGFSTSEQVTDLSGRGVGMDVVKTNIEKLGGKIELDSELGRGTTVRLILPLTLAIISALLVVANNQTFAIPQANVRELLLIQPGESYEKRIEIVNKRPVLYLRGRVIPLILLGEILVADELHDSYQDNNHAIDIDKVQRVLIVKSGNLSYGLVVDSVYDTEEILVKPLSPALGSCGLYSGMTVLGDGSIAMILDTESLRVGAGIELPEESWQMVAQESRVSDEENQSLLLFKCSGGEMLGLDLAMVSRVEEVDITALQKVGAKYYVAFQGQTTRVIRPEHYLPIARRKNKLSKVYVIIPRMERHAIGIIAETIYDTVSSKVVLDKDGVCGTGILGSALIENQLVTLVNIHELFFAAAPEYYSSLSAGKGIRDAQNNAGVSRAKKIKVLLAEDMPFFQRVVRSYLESEGYEVLTAENGKEALDKLLQNKVDIVISDIEMPVMTGIELVRAIRANEGLRHLPVIALTSLNGETNKEKGLRAGFTQYENKLDRLRLLECIHNALENRA